MDESQLESYISKAENANTHHSKAYHFSNFVRDVLCEKIDIELTKETLPELEEYLINEKGTITVQSKTVDPPRNSIIEFKTSKLSPWGNKEIIEKAKEQLRSYIFILWRKQGAELQYLLIASDGLRNFVYKPSLKGDLESITERKEDKIGKDLDRQLKEIIKLEKINDIDISKADTNQVQDWLDHYLIGVEKSPNSQD
ncbi:MAG: hypothetical protein ACOCSA_02365 [Candidatus Hadarchaeota archaeon]